MSRARIPGADPRAQARQISILAEKVGDSPCAGLRRAAQDARQRLLHLDVKDLRPLELRERRALLRKHLRKAPPALLYSDGTDGEALFRHECAMGLELIISKRVDSRHEKWPVPQLGEGQNRSTCDGDSSRNAVRASAWLCVAV